MYRKIVSIVLAMAMLFTAASAFAVTDEEVTQELGALGLMEAFLSNDGYGPRAVMTRAEGVALVCHALNWSDPGPTVTAFHDVPKEHWASGYIDMAYQNNIVDGCGDGNFRPEDEMTYDQFIKVMVAALGYQPAAEAKGGYPTGYLAVASQNQMTNGSGGVTGEPVLRNVAARILCNSLDVPMMVQASWGSDITFRPDPNKTIRIILTAE